MRNKSLPSDIATIHGMTHDGKGIATVSHKKILISGALLNETIAYTIKRKKRHFSEGVATEIIHPAQNRTTPICKHFGLCGGCSLQHMHMQSQLEFMQQTVLEQLKYFAKVVPTQLLPPICAEVEGYRRKARLGVKFVIKKNKLLVGFRERASNYLADITECEVLYSKVGKNLKILSQLIADLQSFADIPQIEVAVGDAIVALVFRHLKPLSQEDKKRLIAFGVENNFHIYLQPNAPACIHKIWPPDGKDRLSYSLSDYQLELLFHPLDFTQINLTVNRLMIKQALQELELNSNDSILDLFCGIGNFTLPIARFVRQVDGVEGSEEMVKRGEENALHNRIQNVRFHKANLESLSKNDAWLQQTYDKLILDPPRTGAKNLIPYVNQLGCRRIVYISCNPATFARDAGMLVHEQGYDLHKVGIINMFPHTAHIEAMGVFDKAPHRLSKIRNANGA